MLGEMLLYLWVMQTVVRHASTRTVSYRIRWADLDAQKYVLRKPWRVFQSQILFTVTAVRMLHCAVRRILLRLTVFVRVLR